MDSYGETLPRSEVSIPEFVVPDLSKLSSVELKRVYLDLVDKYRTATSEKFQLFQEAKKRQETFQQKESDLKNEVMGLEQKIRHISNIESSFAHFTEHKMIEVRNLHEKVLGQVNNFQAKHSSTSHVSENDVVQAFRNKINDMNAELKKEKSKNETGAQDWIDRCNKMSKELILVKDSNDTYSREVAKLTKENTRLNNLVKTQEEDRNFLVKQLVGVKKENARLRLSLSQNTPNDGVLNDHSSTINNLSLISSGTTSLPLPSVNGAVTSPTTSLTLMAANDPQAPLPASLIFAKSKRPSTGTASSKNIHSANGLLTNSRSISDISTTEESSLDFLDGNTITDNPDQEQRFVEVIKRLKKSLDAEQKKCRTLRNQYASHLSERTELEGFLRQAIDEVKRDINSRLSISKNNHRTSNASRKTLGLGIVQLQLPQGRPLSMNSLQNNNGSSKSLLNDTGIPTLKESASQLSVDLKDFTLEDRESVLKTMLSNSEVLQILADSIFKKKPARVLS